MVLLAIADCGIEKPSTSTPQKRPSPNFDDYELSSKRLNTSRGDSFDAKNESSAVDIRRKNDAAGENGAVHHTTADESLAGDERTTDESLASCSQNEDSEMSHEIAEPVPSNNSNSITKPALNVKSMCIDSKLTNKKFMKDFSTEWFACDSRRTSLSVDYNACKKFNNDTVKLFNKPFKLCVMSEFLENSSFTQQIVDEMSQMEWHRKQMDLYEFHQTTDLANLPPNAKPALQRFYNMLLNNMLPWMKQITGLPLSRISASCSMYNYGDYLLVHDDLLSDRQIAFVYYLSPWCEEWAEQMGGALELFESNPLTEQPKYPIVRKFMPRNNQFVFFRVCKRSFHQVGEVTNLVYPRLTINGWFHGPSSNKSIMDSVDVIEEIDNDIEVVNADQYQRATADDLDLNEWINSTYLRTRAKHSIQQHIEDKSEASLEMFLISEFFDLLVSEFKSPGLNWMLEGPANQRKYESLHFSPQSTGPLKDLYTLFTSESMFELLQEYTELDLYGLNAETPTCSVQLCRFTQGCYTLLGDSSTFADSALDVILFFNARDGVGKVTYLSPQCANEYNTTADTDATSSSMNATGVGDSDISTASAITKSASNLTKISKHIKQKLPADQPKNGCGSSNTSKDIELEELEEENVSVDDLSSSNDLQGSKLNTIMKNVAAINSSAGSTKEVVRAEVHGSNETDHYEVESGNSEMGSGDEDYDELTQEDALLTIHPKNNSLNLVYRLSGQTKFVKYISKNSLKPDEYVYVLFASYKE